MEVDSTTSAAKAPQPMGPDASVSVPRRPPVVVVTKPYQAATAPKEEEGKVTGSGEGERGNGGSQEGGEG